MANRPVFYSFVVKDGDGEKTAVRLLKEVADTTTIASLLTATASLATLIDNCLDGKVVSYSVGVHLPTAGGTVKANPVAGCEIERTGLITFDLVSTTDTYSVDFPAWAQDKFSGNSIVLTDSDVVALLAELNGGSYVNRYEVLLGGNTLDGVKTFRKHRKQTKRARGVS